MRLPVTFLVLFATAAAGQISERPADLILPVVGSTAGQSNARFRTELQLTNPGGTTLGGWLVYRPEGRFLRYEIPPRATVSFVDVVAAMNAAGLGSLDVIADRGGIPTVVARAYDDQPAGTPGVTVPAIPSTAVLQRDDTAALIVPRDLTRYRFNVGVRALGAGATLDLVVRSAAGTERHLRRLTFGADAFQQQPGSAFAGVPLQADDSIAIRIASGSAIVYATTVDNITNDSSMQVLRK